MSLLLHGSALVLAIAVWRPPALDWSRILVVPPPYFSGNSAPLVYAPNSPFSAGTGTALHAATRRGPASRAAARPAGMPELPAPVALQSSAIATTPPPSFLSNFALPGLPMPAAAAPGVLPPVAQAAPPPDAPPPALQTPVDTPTAPILAMIASSIAGAFPASPQEREAELRYGPAIRTEHPAKGRFDVVVQSATSELASGPEHMLSGRPIYTVYLPAGEGKPWILQFCKPATPSSGSDSGPVVRLVAPPRIEPPYPLLTFRPLLTMQSAPPYVYLSGLMDEEGTFETLQALSAMEPSTMESLLGWLRLWRFRPAAQDGVSIRVEFLLAVPVEAPPPS